MCRFLDSLFQNQIGCLFGKFSKKIFNLLGGGIPKVACYHRGVFQNTQSLILSSKIFLNYFLQQTETAHIYIDLLQSGSIPLPIERKVDGDLESLPKRMYFEYFENNW